MMDFFISELMGEGVSFGQLLEDAQGDVSSRHLLGSNHVVSAPK
jgi:hypothetical protein